jgi:parallel beta-helix repeat protein
MAVTGQHAAGGQRAVATARPTRRRALPAALVMCLLAVGLQGPAMGVAAAADCGPARTVTANADSWVDESSPSVNKGTDSALTVRAKNRASARALVGFAAPSDVPAGCVVASATLRLFAASARTGRTLQALRVTGAWEENTVTWANQPQTQGAAATTPSGSGQGYREWDVTGQVQAVPVGANPGFLVRDASETGGGFEQRLTSREGSANPPQLVVTYVSTTAPDTQAPTVEITSGPEGSTTETSASFAFTATDDVTPAGDLTVECSLDGGAFAACVSPKTYENLAVGAHTFAVRATDAAGNTSAPATRSWTLATPGDTRAPTVEITSGPADPTAETAAVFDFTVEDEVTPVADLVVECQLDTGGFTECTSGVAYSDLVPGSHTFDVRAADEAGNVGSASYTWRITDTCPVPAVLTESLVLDQELSACSDGLVIGADNITVDLNGHTVSGLDVGVGIRNPGYDGVTVKNGTIRGFEHGVQLTDGASGNVLEDLTVELHKLTGVQVSAAEGTQIRTSRVTGNGEGLAVVDGSTATTVSGSALSLNSGAGARIEDADGNTLLSNTVDTNGDAGVLVLGSDQNVLQSNEITGDSDQAVLFVGSQANTLRGNTVAGSGDAGVVVSAGSHANLIEGNTLTGTGDAGVQLSESDRNRVIGNTARAMADGGIVLTSANDSLVSDNDVRSNPDGIEVHGSSGNRIERNQASSTTGMGILLGSGSVQNLLVGNTANGNNADGIHVASVAGEGLGNTLDGNTTNDNLGNGIYVGEAQHTITGNTAHRNAKDGIYLGKAGNTATNNTADDNTAWGINAAAGTIDGGGNSATGNGQELQCTGVVCGLDTTIDSGPDPETTDRSATFTFSANEPGATFECWLRPPNSSDTPSWQACTSPQQYTGLALGDHELSVRARVADPHGDRIDLTPAQWSWKVLQGDPGNDTIAPTAQILSGPDSTSSSRSATFTFTGADDVTPPGSLQFECRLDAADAEAEWVECASPKTYSGLEQGPHTFEVRAKDEAGNEGEPVSYSWTVGEPVTCDDADFTVVASADSWIDQNSPAANRGADGVLKVTSKAPGLNTRALVQFPIPAGVPAGCELESARLRMYADGDTVGRTLLAQPLASAWAEDVVSWVDQPATTGDTATTASGAGYRQWDVTSQVGSVVFTGAAHNGFLIRDAAENDSSGVEQGFFSRENGENPPVLTVRFTAPGGGSDPGDPEPTTVSCGQELRSSVLVMNDLSGCIDGLVVGRQGITVDLNGHTIAGTGLGAGLRNDGYDGVTLRNGTVENFDYGVQLNPGTDGNVVEALTVDRNELAGIELTGAGTAGQGTMVRGNTVIWNGRGIAVLGGSTAATVLDNTVDANTRAGLVVQGSDGNTLRGNEVTLTADAAVVLDGADENLVEQNGISGSSDAGVRLVSSSSNTLRGNTLEGTGDGGMLLTEASDGNRLEGNTLIATGDAGILIADSDRNRVLFNVSHDMSDSGITLNDAHDGLVQGNDVRFNPGGIELSHSSGNVVAGNDASEGTGYGIEVGEGSIDNDILFNTAEGNSAAGIHVNAPASIAEGNRITGNITHGNAGDGILVAMGGHTIASNTANGNSGYGIYAAAGNVDGGGNRARENGEAVQCVGVVCSDDSEPHPGAPGTIITERPTNPTTQTSARFAFEGFDDTTPAAELTFECRLDEQAFVSCSSPVDYVDLAVGSHTFQVRAVDGGGLADPSPATYTWTVLPAGDVGEPTSVECGDVLTQSTLVLNDLTDCADDGLVIGADGITVDLGGHTLAGVGAGTGIRNDGHDDVTIVNGQVREFASGLRLGPGTSHNLVHTLELRDSTLAGLEVDGADSNRAMSNTVVDNAVGISLVGGAATNLLQANLVGRSKTAIEVRGSDENRLESNTVSQAADEGIVLETAAGNRVVNNTVSATGDAGVLIQAGSHDNVVRGNTLSQVADAGVLISDSDRNEVTANTAQLLAATGVALQNADDGVVRGNDLRFNAGGLDLSASSGNLLENNLVSDGNGTGIALGPDSVRNVVRGNEASRNNAGGIVVSGAAEAGTGNLIEQNTASGNNGDGISVSSSVHTVSGNVANGNTAWGITAVAGNVDGGGNRASGNGQAEQCTGVVCIQDQTITSGPPETTEDRSATFEFSSPDAGVTFECSLDGAEFSACTSPITYTGLALGAHTFQVRAVYPDGSVSPSPAEWLWEVDEALDEVPPDTEILSGPADPTKSRTATFTFTGSDNSSPAEFLEFECRLDSTDELAWDECVSPASYTNLVSGQHTLEVRAVDEAGNVDETPASYTWTILPPETCAEASLTVSPDADAWVNEGSPDSNGGDDSTLAVQSKGPDDNARALVRFDLPTDTPADCELTSATLRLYSPSATPGRTLQALPVTSPWGEQDVTWNSRPATGGPAATASSGLGYRSWNVTTQVGAMLATLPSHGFLIRDAIEGEDAAQEFHSKEKLESEPRLVLVYNQEGYEPPPPPPLEEPQPAEVECGQVLTASTLVLNDLDDCPGDGLVIGARIILDLNGRTIDGVGLVPNVEVEPAGIRNLGYDDVIVRNGTVQQFHVGVSLLPDSDDNAVRDLTVQDNVVAGVALHQANGTLVRDNDLIGNGDGVTLADSTGGVIAANTLTANLDTAIKMQDSSGIGIESNTLTGGVDGLRVGDEAMRLEGSTGNTIVGNTASGTGDGGVLLIMGSDDNRVEGNELVELGDAGVLVADSDGNQVVANTARGMSDAGVRLTNASDTLVQDNDLRSNPSGVQADDSSRNLITGNDVSQSGGTGIELGVGSLQNRVLSNTANGSGGRGIYVEGDAEPGVGNLIEANAASHNGGGGIVVAKAVHTITGNTAYNNGGWGIYAADGNVDGGGNVASGNGELDQCYNVLCATGNPPPPPPLDVEPPETHITNGPSASTRDNIAIFSFIGVDDVTPAEELEFECRLDSTDELAWEECESPVTYTDLALGEHTFAVRAIDEEDNVDPTPATHTWTVLAPAECGSLMVAAADADAWIDESSAQTNKGTDSILKVRSQGPAGNFRALVRFSTPTSVPDGCVVESATLRMYSASSTAGRTLQALRIGSTWSESAVRWSTQPPTAGPAATTASGAGYREWNVTEQVGAMYVSGNHGFLIRDAVENGGGAEQALHSREKGESPPQLLLRFGPAPSS